MTRRSRVDGRRSRDRCSLMARRYAGRERARRRLLVRLATLRSSVFLLVFSLPTSVRLLGRMLRPRRGRGVFGPIGWRADVSRRLTRGRRRYGSTRRRRGGAMLGLRRFSRRLRRRRCRRWRRLHCSSLLLLWRRRRLRRWWCWRRGLHRSSLLLLWRCRRLRRWWWWRRLDHWPLLLRLWRPWWRLGSRWRWRLHSATLIRLRRRSEEHTS